MTATLVVGIRVDPTLEPVLACERALMQEAKTARGRDKCIYATPGSPGRLSCSYAARTRLACPGFEPEEKGLNDLALLSVQCIQHGNFGSPSATRGKFALFSQGGDTGKSTCYSIGSGKSRLGIIRVTHPSRRGKTRKHSSDSVV